MSPTELGGGVVLDAMVRRPTTSPDHASVADVRALLADDHVHMALLVSGDLLVGTVTRADLDAARGRSEPAAAAVTLGRLEGRTVAPGTSLESARALLVSTAQRRLAVVDDAGRLLGLLCLKRTRDGFCSDLDVASRAAAVRPAAG